MTYVALSGEPVGDAGDIYTGLDRFNRVVDVRWINASNTDINRFKYTFSRASNRLTRQNVVASSGGFDEQYLYDNLYEVTTRLQGTLSGGVITGTPVEEEDFTFDPTGNWPGYVIKESGTITLNQTRAHQTANEITAISGGVTPGYDGTGNMTTMPQVDNWSTAQTVTYDAWNRPITVVQSGTTLGTYQYDGLNRRIWKQSLESGTLTTRDFYYSNQWQVLEERTDSNTTADTQYVWGTRYRDDLVLRDRLMGTTDRFYALADYFQPTAIADTSGVVQERYVYRAFGDVSYYNGSFGTISSSAYEWEYLYGTYYYDIETALYQVRNRYYHSTLGRWLTRDPIGERGGINLYAYVRNSAVNRVDPSGLIYGCYESLPGTLIFKQGTGWKLDRYELVNDEGGGGMNFSSTVNAVIGEWKANVCVVCCCLGLSQTLCGDRIYKSGHQPITSNGGQYNYPTIDARAIPMLPGPEPDIFGLIGEFISHLFRDTIQELPSQTYNLDPVFSADVNSALSNAKPTSPTQGEWGSGNNPCDA